VREPRRVLLDECVPVKLRRELAGFNVRAVREYGWASKLDGELLRAADAEFDILVTVDQNLVYQQNLAGLQLAIVVLIAFTNNFRELRKLVPELLPVIGSIQPGEVVRVGPPLDDRNISGE
jgi:predicted nuclease of predicted toxin-antitoxin system